MSKKRIGIIGVGSMGKNHVRAYSALKDICELVGIYDVDYSHAKKIANSFGVKAFESMDKLMKEVDAVNIVTPTSTHYELAKKAIDNNLHLLIEKPITSEVEDAEEIIKEAKKRELVLQVGHIERFNPAIRALPDILEGEEIISIDAKRLGPYNGRINDTDVIQDLMIHDIDIINSIIKDDLGDISAVGSKRYSDYIDHALAVLTMDNDIIVNIEASRATYKRVRTLTITTLSSYIELDYIQRKIVINTGHLLPEGKGYHLNQAIEELYDSQEDALESQLSHFIDCIENKQKPLIDGRDALKALKISKDVQAIITENLDKKYL
ncbi:Gfo/Idh/MocA family oxidoreductase [Natronospora cellulosivora (SeqCode)]